MNKQRRSLISKNINMLENIKESLEDILSDEELCFDNMPENLQSSLRGEQSENAIDLLGEAIDELSNVIDSLLEIV